MVPDASGNTNLALSATARLPRQDKPSPFAATSGLFGCRRVDWMNFVSRKSCRGQRAQHVISSRAAKAIPSILKGRSCINDGRRGCPPPNQDCSCRRLFRRSLPFIGRRRINSSSHLFRGYLCACRAVFPSSVSCQIIFLQRGLGINPPD